MRYFLAVCLIVIVAVVAYAQWPSSMIDIDTASGVVIQEPHNLIHKGRMFTYSATQLLDNAATKQTATFTVGGTVEVGDIFNITIGTETMSYVAVQTNTSTVATNIAAEARGEGTYVPDNYFNDVAWTGPAAVVTAISDVAGREFAGSISTTDADGSAGAQTFVADWAVAANTPKILDFLIETGAKEAHISFRATGELNTTVKLFTSPSRGTGILQTTYNRNGGSTETPLTILSKYPTKSVIFNGTSTPLITTFGLDTGVGAGAVLSGGGTRDQNEWLMEENEVWLITIETISDDNQANFQINWYETD